MIKLGLKSRSRRVVQDTTVAVENSKTGDGGENRDDVEEDGDLSCWEALPSELLRDILMKLEESESNWPSRKDVVACAGVCRSWRDTMKELVKIPEVSGKITFPISVKQPGPRESLIPCFIKRNRSTQTYYLYASLSQALANDGKFLLAAQRFKRTTSTDYMISLQANDMSKGSPAYIGKLRCNLLGRRFVVYDALPPHCGVKMLKSRSAVMVGSKQVSSAVPVGNYPVAHISYELNVLGARGPRRMHCVLDAIPSSAVKPGGAAPTPTHFPITTVDSYPSIPFLRSKSNYLNKSPSRNLTDQVDTPLVLQNKAPRWHEQLQCWCLNFHGRVTAASVKNFQLVASPENGLSVPEHDRVVLQFGKVGKDEFTMDYGYPISAFQAFAICLSSFDTKIACE
ncbi:tubby-like F-box protein 3 [Andrographis paniculata]|uniref:tubby-like F-box protein 3 n=1 Tax=Andrographis paniculata TaxID=175694 RepID=UPI0021E7C519|nr:tubby-like F-box protein 3 [Andrographis paniculata]